MQRNRILLFTLLTLAFFSSGDLLAQRGGFRFEGEARADQLEPDQVEFRDGAGAIPDLETFEKLSYKGPEVMIDTHLAEQQFVKFQLEGADTDEPKLYFINTKTHRAHMMFMRAVGISMNGMRDPSSMKGVLIYHPRKMNPSGGTGLFTFEFEPFDKYAYDQIKACYDQLQKKMPLLEGRLGYYPMPEAIPQTDKDMENYQAASLPVYKQKDIEANVGYLPLNMTKSWGMLTELKLDKQPSPREIVLCRTLPNEMPRVAGIISAVRQTPLSHVNLRAIQDNVPNAFITDAADNKEIRSLMGEFVYYKVTADSYEIRKATAEEVDKHFAAIRPAERQTPTRDLTAKTIRELDGIGFEDSKSVGVKAANLATLRTLGFSEGTVPDGFAIPFYFYDEFMKHNGFYKTAQAMIDDPEFQADREKQDKALKKFRGKIRKGDMPEWMMAALDEVHKSFPAGTPVRCRSSTNNEDLPGFSGAGLYDSCTHQPDEGHFSKSVKQIYASLWNFRAFEERDFYRIDHLATAMGILIHPSFTDELANGVCVTEDILYQTLGNHYLNTQVGEDLVTNPEEQSVPEELLLDWSDAKKVKVMRYSNRNEGQQILEEEHLKLLRVYLGKIHQKFAELYGADLQDSHFAMEIEFKITQDGTLIIKQARPWVFAVNNSAVSK